MRIRPTNIHPIVLVAIVLITLTSSACSSINSHTTANSKTRLSDDERHRLYAAALAVSESPLDSEVFKDVCRQIGIFDEHGRPNDQYMLFVSQHIDWGVRSETEQFRREINSKERARDYLMRHLSQ